MSTTLDGRINPKTVIALDYDNTYTRHPEYWNTAIHLGKAHGIRYVIVTYRDERFDRTAELDLLSITVPVYYTRGVAKKFFMEHFGEHIDNWIDDRPETILSNSTATPDVLSDWRRKDTPVPYTPVPYTTGDVCF